jgi:hypothetical protein
MREDFMCAVVTAIFGACNSVRLSQLFVVAFCKCSINPTINPKPVYSHSYSTGRGKQKLQEGPLSSSRSLHVVSWLKPARPAVTSTLWMLGVRIPSHVHTYRPNHTKSESLCYYIISDTPILYVHDVPIAGSPPVFKGPATSSDSLLFIIILSEVRLSPLGTAATTGLFYQPQMTDDGDRGAIGGMKIGRGNRSTRRKPAPRATLSTTNTTWPDPGSNPGRRGGKPATNRLSYGAALATACYYTLRWCGEMSWSSEWHSCFVFERSQVELSTTRPQIWPW